MVESKYALPTGTVLDGKYQLVAVLGVGGFGIVYKAKHQLLGAFVAIKEYLPLELALREGEQIVAVSRSLHEDYQQGLQRFVDEAKQLVRFSAHPNIVGCHDFFQANGTAYLVMNFEEGEPLSELISRREQAGENLSQTELLNLLQPMLSGLSYIHQHDVLHRDIKPENIFIRRSNGQPVLLDFGAAKTTLFATNSLAAFTSGYAAPEQTDAEGELGPWTDIYAVGALMWRIIYRTIPPKTEMRLFAAVRGKPDPANAVELPDHNFSSGMIKLVQGCMALDRHQRPQSVRALAQTCESLHNPQESPPAPSTRPSLSGNTATLSQSAAAKRTVAPRKAEFRHKSLLRFGLGVVLLLAGALVASLLLPLVSDRTRSLDAHIEQSLQSEPDVAAVDEAISTPTDSNCEQLSLERNRLFKRHGYCFQSARMIELLGNKGCDQSDSAVVFNTRFSEAERASVQAIRAQEQSLGCI